MCDVFYSLTHSELSLCLCADGENGDAAGVPAGVRPDIDLDKELLVFQDQVLGSGATGFVFKGLYKVRAQERGVGGKRVLAASARAQSEHP
jgi:hypothetical protein